MWRFSLTETLIAETINQENLMDMDSITGLAKLPTSASSGRECAKGKGDGQEKVEMCMLVITVLIVKMDGESFAGLMATSTGANSART